eukprot:scaffold13377_cov61-Phaeocystis_antarctica.AAC.7
MGRWHLRPEVAPLLEALHDGGDVSLDVRVRADVVALVPPPSRTLLRARAARESAREGQGTRKVPVSKSTAGVAIWPAGADRRADWPRLAGAPGSLRHARPGAVSEPPERQLAEARATVVSTPASWLSGGSLTSPGRASGCPELRPAASASSLWGHLGFHSVHEPRVRPSGSLAIAGVDKGGSGHLAQAIWLSGSPAIWLSEPRSFPHR